MATKKLLSIALVAVVIVFAGSSLSYAAPHGGGHAVAGHPAAGHFGGHPGIGRFPGHPPFVRPGFHGRTFVRGPHVGVFLGAPFYVPPVYPYYYSPAYTYEQAPSYWYYCASYGQYYPNVSSCPEAWVPVPAQ